MDDAEPKPLPDLVPFEDWDFEALAQGRARNTEYNDRRLAARRKLASVAKSVVAIAKKEKLALDSRTSLHHPHAFNGNQVRRIWAYVTRAKAEKTRLRKVIGPELAKDLDSAYRNAYLCVAIEHGALEVSFRIHTDAWYDGQNFVRRTKAEGSRGLYGILNELEGFDLRLHDWKGEWPCGRFEPERLDEYLSSYVPGEHSLAVERRWPVPADLGPAREAALGDDVPTQLVSELERLFPLYRYAAWSKESDFLFSS